jgi:hypothetical protein
VKQVTVSPACLTQFLADFPPGQPAVTVGTVTFPEQNVSLSGTVKPA